MISNPNNQSGFAKGKKFILKSVFNDNINYILYANDIRKISPGLEKLSIDSYLGKSKYGKTILVRKNKENQNRD